MNDWQPYEPCPNCGSKDLWIHQLSIHQCKVNENGDVVEKYGISSLDMKKDEQRAICDSCGIEMIPSDGDSSSED